MLKPRRTLANPPFKSHHHPQHKYSVVRTLMDRAKNIPSTEEEAVRETKRAAEALTANNYPANFIYNGRQRNRQQEVNDSDQRGMVVLPYAKGFSEKIARARVRVNPAEEGNSSCRNFQHNILASVNFFIIFNMPGYTPNDYPLSFLQKITKTIKPSSSAEPTIKYKSAAVLSYVKGLSEQLRCCLKQQGISAVFKSETTLRSYLVRPKDAVEPTKLLYFTLGISGWGCAAGTLEPLAYTRASFS